MAPRNPRAVGDRGQKSLPEGSPAQADLRPHRLLLALELLGFELHGRGQAATYTELGPSLLTGGRLFRLPLDGETRDCSREELRRAVADSDRIPDGAVHRPENRNEAALHRFLLGAAEENAADALIDYVIALEALLLPEHSEGELRFRLAVFGSHYLGGDRGERGTIFRDFQTVYDARSEIVHGAKRYRL